MCYNSICYVHSRFGFEVIDMPAKKMVLDIDYLVSEYRAGRSCEDIGRELGVNGVTIGKRLKSVGVTPNCGRIGTRIQKLCEVGDAEIARRYLSGESENAIAATLGVSRTSIKLILDRAGIARRSLAETGRLE